MEITQKTATLELILNSENPKILIIQTAHIGDVVLALPVAQRIRSTYPNASIHFLLRNGNQNLLENHPAIDSIHTFDRKRKISSMYSCIRKLRKEKFDLCINLQRFFSSGFIATFSASKEIIGFNKNPMSLFYSQSFNHKLSLKESSTSSSPIHEVERNLSLLEGISDIILERPHLFPSENDRKKIEEHITEPYYVIAPASVWKTKELPERKWVELINRLIEKGQVYIIGGKADVSKAEGIMKKTNHPEKVKSFCGTLSFLQSTALIEKAKRTFTNDSATLHFASAVNAPITSFFLSTIPEFGFGPLSDDREIIEKKDLECRPCGLHGKRVCPEGHFKCGLEVDLNLIEMLK